MDLEIQQNVFMFVIGHGSLGETTLYTVTTTALIVMMPQTHGCLLPESHTWNVFTPKDVTTTKAPDLWIDYNHDLYITGLNAQPGFLPVSWFLCGLSSGHYSIATFH